MKTTLEKNNNLVLFTVNFSVGFRAGPSTLAKPRMDLFVTIVNGFQPLAIVKKGSVGDVARVPNPLLVFPKIYSELSN